MPAEVDAAKLKALEVIRVLDQKVGKMEDELERLVKARECADEAAKNLENELRNSMRKLETRIGAAHAKLAVAVTELKTGTNTNAVLNILYGVLDTLKD